MKISQTRVTTAGSKPIHKGGRTALRSSGFTLVLVLAAASCAEQELVSPEPVGRILLITVDTLRASSTTPYGAPRETTPHLSDFARHAVQFDQAYVTMPTTCPSHISMLTGLYPRQHGSMRNGVPARSGLVSLPRRLEENGWRTAAFVSVPFLGREALGLDGFDTWDAPSEVQAGARTVDRALAWARSHAAEPFFLWVHLFDPHSPYERHDGLQAELAADLDRLRDVPTRNDYSFLRRPMLGEEARKLELLYEADVFYTDQQIGRLLGFFEESGLGRGALTVIVSDHGEVLGEVLSPLRYGFDHGEFLLPGEIRAGLWIRGPTIEGGTRNPAVVETRALYGSMLWAAGIEPGPLAPRLPGLGAKIDQAGAAFVTRRSFSGGHVPPVLQGERYAMVTGGMLTVCKTGPQQGVELFDLRDDPLGLEDLAARRPGAANELARVAGNWWGRHSQGVEPRPQIADEELREQLRSLGYVH